MILDPWRPGPAKTDHFFAGVNRVAPDSTNWESPGHLDAGGHFHVKQEEVQPGYWELAVMDVEMKGKALFFKTIGVQEETKRSMFRRVRDDLTAAQGADLLYQQVRTTSEVRESFPRRPGRDAATTPGSD